MCGIAGYFGSATIGEDRLQRCLALMGRRGPDHAAAEKFTNDLGKHCYLLHSRLSIIDLGNQGNQPFHVGDVAAVFNGELYNYIELRDELAAAGVPFHTRSDTEVFVSALATAGWPVLDRCEGMWALALYDRRDGSLSLSRDRFGEKPLFIYRTADGVYFGSEAKFIFALLGRALPINQNQIARFLVNGYKSIYKGRDTFFDGLEEVQPGCTLTIDAAGRCREDRYWTPSYRPDEQMSYDDAVAGCRQHLLDAVRIRLRSDVPMAFLLSGGVDSNAIVSIAKRIFGHDVHGFTIVNEDERYDERTIVEDAVATLGLRHTPVYIRPKRFLPRLRDLVAYHDAPVFTITYYIQWLLMEQVHNSGYRVTFSGTGADEMVSGYYDHHLMYLSEVKGSPLYDDALAAWTRHVKPEVRNPFLSNPTQFCGNLDFRDHIYLNNDVFATYLKRPFHEAFEETCYTRDSLLRNRMMNEMFHEGVRVILHEDDLNAMYFSIENRSPFLDRKLFEFCYRIPTRHLIRDGFNKAVLRDAVRGLAPDSVTQQRRKVGFNAPVESFLDTTDQAVVAELLADSPVFDIVRPEMIAEMLKKQNLPNSESKFLFNFVSVKMFLEQFSSWK